MGVGRGGGARARAGRATGAARAGGARGVRGLAWPGQGRVGQAGRPAGRPEQHGPVHGTANRQATLVHAGWGLLHATPACWPSRPPACSPPPCSLLCIQPHKLDQLLILGTLHGPAFRLHEEGGGGEAEARRESGGQVGQQERWGAVVVVAVAVAAVVAGGEAPPLLRCPAEGVQQAAASNRAAAAGGCKAPGLHALA